MSECGLCMHHPRTPHTSECVFPYGLAPPSPVALMPGPPRPLGATPPQRPVPHIAPLSASLYQRSIKQEKLDGKYCVCLLCCNIQDKSYVRTVPSPNILLSSLLLKS